MLANIPNTGRPFGVDVSTPWCKLTSGCLSCQTRKVQSPVPQASPETIVTIYSGDADPRTLILSRTMECARVVGLEFLTNGLLLKHLNNARRGGSERLILLRRACGAKDTSHIHATSP
jgi:hypothetical protein